MSAYFQLKNFKVQAAIPVSVDEVSLNEHDWLQISAPSGFGKTTLLRGILGLEKIEGEVWLDGVQIDKLPLHKRNIGVAFQDHLLFSQMTVAENVGYGLKFRKSQTIQEQVKRALGQVGISDKYDAPVSLLSGGERQRIAILRALIWEPKLLILDEPFKGLDESNIQLILKLIQEFNAHHRTAVICVSHPQEGLKQTKLGNCSLSGNALSNVLINGDAPYERHFTFDRQ